MLPDTDRRAGPNDAEEIGGQHIPRNHSPENSGKVKTIYLLARI